VVSDDAQIAHDVKAKQAEHDFADLRLQVLIGTRQDSGVRNPVREDQHEISTEQNKKLVYDLLGVLSLVLVGLEVRHIYQHYDGRQEVNQNL
jgi:hypothetical protein